ncbi:phytanoyl-CoA dioxygenase family protein [Candidatus Pelagibacter sp. HIMB1509]|uniref:phytanoyl-CoA dioxygenase family protein n=1 Tax=Candidatus Pelagibacter sp. HIMB1509 TaxID=3413339 RepID=UPI003F82BA30
MLLNKNYIKIKNFLDKKDHTEIIKLILKNIKIKQNNIKLISNKIIDNYKNDPSSISTLQDNLKESIIIKKISKTQKYKKKIGNIIKNKKKSLFVDFNLRIDLPSIFDKEDKKMSLPWHQDFSYYQSKTNLINYDGYVIYIPLYKLGTKEGSLIVDATPVNKFKKHKKKYLDVKNKKFLRHKLEKFKPKKEININLSERDALLMDFFCIHKSGKNTSNKVRFTLLIRYKFLKN